jgi:short subunit dehydrogenase-like uncharacterized protein
MSEREFDVIVFGATGYTGRLVAEHLLKSSGVKWAMAGRSKDKLADVRAEIGAPASLPLVVADVNDKASLDAMVKRTKVLITTAGPYQLYGSPVVAACAAAGTDYVDLTGESHWIAQMMAAHDAEAKKTGARLVFSCGFDSIPFDLGVYFAEEEAKKKFGHYVSRVRGRLRGMAGGVSGGTVASGQTTMMAMAKDPAIAGVLGNPFALTPGFTGVKQPDGDTPHEDKVTGSWVGPFMMAGINTKAVHRTNFLLGNRWGKDFQYCEMQMLDGPPASGGAGTGGFSFAGDLPKPGEGPTKEQRDNGWYDILFIAEDKDGRTARIAVKGDRDPGYGSTAKILAEAALVLKDVPHSVTPGGCYSPGGAMAEPLLKRLPTKAGLTFTVEG